MDSIEYVQTRMKKLDRELSKFSILGENTLLMIESSFFVVDKTVEEIKDWVKGSGFQSEKEEIQFFKLYMTELLSRSYFYSELFLIESNKPLEEEEKVFLFYQEQIEEIRRYFHRYVALNNYLVMGKTYLDRVYFLRASDAPLIYPDLVRHTLDSQFCTVYTLYFGRLKAMGRLMNFLLSKVGDVGKGIGKQKEERNDASGLLWTGSKVELVELIYALKCTSVINHGSASVSDLASVLGTVFGKRLRGFYKTFEEIRSRKSNKTLFLDKCKDRLDSFISGYEEKE